MMPEKKRKRESGLEHAHWRRCERKRRYSEPAAVTIARQLSEESGELLLAYKCFDCGSWHVGHADEAQLLARENDFMGKGKPKQCVICGEPIHEAKLLHARNENQEAKYCSQRCGKKARRRRSQAAKRKREKAKQAEEMVALSGDAEEVQPIRSKSHLS